MLHIGAMTMSKRFERPPLHPKRPRDQSMPLHRAPKTNHGCTLDTVRERGGVGGGYADGVVCPHSSPVPLLFFCGSKEMTTRKLPLDSTCTKQTGHYFFGPKPLGLRDPPRGFCREQSSGITRAAFPSYAMSSRFSRIHESKNGKSRPADMKKKCRDVCSGSFAGGGEGMIEFRRD